MRSLPLTAEIRVMTIGVDERDQDRWNRQDLGSKPGESVEAAICRCFEKSCLMVRTQPNGARQC